MGNDDIDSIARRRSRFGRLTLNTAMNPAASCAINLERVKHDIYSPGHFGCNEQDQGICRRGFGVQGMKTRPQLMEHMCNHGIRRRERPGYTGKKCSGDQRQ